MITRRKLFGLLAGLPFVKAVEPEPYSTISCTVRYEPDAIVVSGSVISEGDLEAHIASVVRESLDKA